MPNYYLQKENMCIGLSGIRRTFIPCEDNLLNLLDMRLSRGIGKCRKWGADLFEVSEERKGRNQKGYMKCYRCKSRMHYKNSKIINGELYHRYKCSNQRCRVKTVSVQLKSKYDIEKETREQMETGLPDIDKSKKERRENDET